MTSFAQIKSSCLSRGELWEDPDFPAAQASVFYHQTPPFNFQWKRAKELYSEPSFVLDNWETFDVIPGRMGDKWLVSCLGVIYLSKGLFYRVVPADQNFDEGYAGVFRFRLWWCGQWLEVLVDDRLPTLNGRLAFLQSSHSEQLWPALLEKAYAKLHGSYEALKYGRVLDGLADLTGGVTECLDLQSSSCAALAPRLQALLRAACVVTCARRPQPILVVGKVAGIDFDMNYRIYELEKVESTDETVYMARLCRPLAPGEAHLPKVVVDFASWKMVPMHERERLGLTRTGFWMSLEDLRKAFTHIEAVHLDAETSRDEPSLADKHPWHMERHQGRWRRGVSAGGCRNNADFFHMNPQVQLTLSEPDTLLISLNQHSIVEPKVIGFSVYTLEDALTEPAPEFFFKMMKSKLNSQYTNSRQVRRRCKLEAGTYLVLPTTFKPREEANFTLRVFASNPLNLKVLDSAPRMFRPAVLRAPAGFEERSFKQYYDALFLQMADEHRTVDAFELQELLENCLPNDYIKSCACTETCRQIVLTMDTRGNGRISLSDFKDLMCSLKFWQEVFRAHAREKMGVLIAERLRAALLDVGFVVPERALALLVLKYMRKDGMLRFGDFVSAILHLQRKFSLFQAKEEQTNLICLNLSEVRDSVITV